MKATLTELRRQTGKVIRPVIHAGKTVVLTEHGQDVAEIRPAGRVMTGAEFARAWKERRSLGKATAEDVAKALKAIDAAE